MSGPGMSDTGTKKNVILAAIAVIALAAAASILWATMRQGGNPDFPEGHPYICLDCGQAFVLTDKELFEIKAKAREALTMEPPAVPCSHCGSKNTYPAVKCPHCGHYFARPGGRPVCPQCGKPFPRPRFGG